MGADPAGPLQLLGIALCVSNKLLQVFLLESLPRHYDILVCSSIKPNWLESISCLCQGSGKRDRAGHRHLLFCQNGERRDRHASLAVAA